MLTTVLTALLVFCAEVHSQEQRTAPPAGAVVVRGSGTKTGEFSTIQAAVTSLPADTSAQTIFIYPGTYTEQVHLTRTSNLTILGYTTNTMDHSANVVRLQFNLSQAQAGGGDLSATLRIDKNNVALYNIDVLNMFGTGSQALAVAGYGTNLGFYAVGFYGYQDTLRAEKGVQFYGGCYISGAVDYIFGQNGHAFFHQCTIASTAPGVITADGPDTASESLFVINQSNITTSGSGSLTGQVFLGRPWSAQAQVVYISSVLGAVINPAGWEVWSSTEPNTSGVLFAEFNSTGPGAAGMRASFSTKLSSTAAAGYGIAQVLGANWMTWVDTAYYV